MAKATIVELTDKFTVNGVELSGLEWNTLLRLAKKVGCPVLDAGKVEKVGKQKGKPANIYEVPETISMNFQLK